MRLTVQSLAQLARALGMAPDRPHPNRHGGAGEDASADGSEQQTRSVEDEGKPIAGNDYVVIARNGLIARAVDCRELV